MKKIVLLLLFTVLLSGCIVNLSLFPELQPLRETVLEGSGKEKILLLNISGVISEEPGDGIVAEPDIIARVREELIKAQLDKKVRAIVLRVDSPGGTVTASDLLYHEIMQFKERTGIKVIASIGGIGASGAYYAAMASDRIVANPTAIIGSVGVIMLHFNLEGLLEKIGVGADAIKSGLHKDTGSPFRKMSPQDRQILQGTIDTLQERFLEMVVKGRKEMTPEQIKLISDGRIFTSAEAKKLKLIDQIGYLDSAIALARQEAGLTEARVVTYRRPHQYIHNIYSKVASLSDPYATWKIDPKALLKGRSIDFFYLWLP